MAPWGQYAPVRMGQVQWDPRLPALTKGCPAQPNRSRTLSRRLLRWPSRAGSVRGSPERRSGYQPGRIGKLSRTKPGASHGPRSLDRTRRPGRVRPQHRDPASAPVPWPYAPSRRRRCDRPRLHRVVLERPDLHRQSGPFRHVLDPRPVVLGAVAGAPRARRARHALARLRARRLDEATQPHHDDDPLLRSPRRCLRIRRRLAAAVPGRAARRRCATDLVERHRPWLEAEIAHYYATVVDPATGLVRSDRKFSAHRDTVVNRSNAYGNTMVALLAKTIEETGWFASPFERHFEGDYGRLLVDHFWADDHFRDALGDETVSGEANVWPFYTGVVTRPGPGRRRPRATSTPTASATRTRCATRRAADPSARSG